MIDAAEMQRLSRCAKCDKMVEAVGTETLRDGSMVITIECHGEEIKMELTSREVVMASQVMPTRAEFFDGEKHARKSNR